MEDHHRLRGSPTFFRELHFHPSQKVTVNNDLAVHNCILGTWGRRKTVPPREDDGKVSFYKNNEDPHSWEAKLVLKESGITCLQDCQRTLQEQYRCLTGILSFKCGHEDGQPSSSPRSVKKFNHSTLFDCGVHNCG
jgi:hypothetical protein